ncbi:hypothetical protein ABFS83_04G072100 [Erythranthe nasuta]
MHAYVYTYKKNQSINPRKNSKKKMGGDEIAGLEEGFDWLRTLVNNNPWEYCVIWKLGDDPSRFIEWGSCFCSGAEIKIKDEKGLQKKQFSFGECRDYKLIKHPIRTLSCSYLAKLPPVIPLYSGIHGDVVISKRARWTFHNNPSASDDQPNGTQVLIPVACGLIELFSTKHVQKDQKIIDYICGGFKLCFKQPNMSENPHTNDYLQKCHFLNFVPQPNSNYSSFEGSSTCSSLSNEPKLNSDSVVLTMLPQIPSKIKRKKLCTDSALARVNEKNGAKIAQKPEKGVFKSKNLVTERNRRKRIKAGMFALRSLVPKITKMDRAATLGDAADYIVELLETIENYEDELKAMEEEDYFDKVSFDELKSAEKKKEGPSDQMTTIKVQVEVSQLGTRDFLVKLVCKQKRGGFSRLMEAMDSLGLQVTDSNVTTFNGSVLTVLKVEAKTMEVEPNSLKHLLVQLIS